MKLLNPYLRFNGNCREAMEFYRECLGGELNLMTVGESAMASQIPAAMKDRIMHSALMSEGMVLMGSDMIGQEGLIKGNSVVLCINGTDKEDIEDYFSKLSSGGKISTPLQTMFFGSYGDFTDRFGVDWIFQISPPDREL